MNYSETVDYLMRALPMYQRDGAAAYKADLSISQALDLYDGYPHQQYATVHVAGTNGKGSVSHMLCAVLMAAGYRVGLFTSPHLVDFRERIRVNGQLVDQDYVTDYVDRHRDIFEELQPSFFEMSAALAFSYFADQKVDLAVIEVGMGGRLDSTNIISPLLSVITNISLDHTAFLGSTLSEIAGEKAGIIKPGTPVVFGETNENTRRVFVSRARQLGAPFRFADQDWRCLGQRQDGKLQSLTFQRAGDGEKLEVVTDLKGAVQAHNIPVVLSSVEMLREQGVRIPKEALLEGMEYTASRTGLRGRWEELAQRPLVVCDTGHNEGGLREVVAQIASTPHAHLHYVLGFVNDKDIDHILPLLPTDATYYFCKASVPRAMEAGHLAGLAGRIGLHGKVYQSVAEAVMAARAAATPEDMVMIGGSTFVVADALRDCEW